MELRTIMKLHFEKLNKRALELHSSSYEKEYKELEAIKNTAIEMIPAFDNDDELAAGVQCLQFNAGKIQRYIKTGELEDLVRPIKNDEGKYMCVPFIPENDLDIETLVQIFRLFKY